MASGKTQAARTNTASVPVQAHSDAAKPTPMKLDPAKHRFVYSQPAADAGKWLSRGVTVPFKWEAQRDPAGLPTVSLAQWEAAWMNAGAVGVIREPSDRLNVDNANANVLALLNRQDEPDNLVVEYRDTGRNPEDVYKASEAWCAATRQGAPLKPLAVNLGLEQIQWLQEDGKTPKVDYARLCAPYDLVFADWYAVLRGRPVSDYGVLLDQLRAIVGPKLVGAFAECSNQNLSYGSRRGPDAVEFGDTLKVITARGLCVGLFSQQLPGINAAGNQLDFAYDAMPAPLVEAFKAFSKTTVVTPPPPPVVTPPAPALPDVLNLTIDGVPYKAVKQ